MIEFDYDDAQLAFLAAHDSDPFNRWEAAQRLAVNGVLAIVGGADVEGCRTPLANALGRLLGDDALDPAFRDQLLLLPSEGFIAEQLAVVDPGAVRAARNALRRGVADALAARWAPLWTSLRDDRPYAAEPAAAGRRALKNTVLAWWVETQAPQAIAAAARQFELADNMTDRVGALHALLRTAAPQREAALARFAQMFADEPLVLDKWFAMQATMHRHAGDPPVLERVRTLLGHPAFSARNPNRVRALVGSFCNGNLAEFHAADGSGYAFWGEQVLATRRDQSASRGTAGARTRSLAQVHARTAGGDARRARDGRRAPDAVQRRWRDRRQGIGNLNSTQQEATWPPASA